jgi:outer membrane protein OmpA-like peptidoglycan-associated protein
MNRYIFLFAITLGLSANAQQGDTISFASPEKLTTTVNSSAEESLPIIGPEGKLYFARTYHPGNKGGKYSGQDIWVSKSDANGFAEAENLKGLNNQGSNVVVGIAKGGKRLYLLNRYASKKSAEPGIARSDYDEATGAWGEPVPVTVQGLSVEGDFYSAFVSENEDYVLWTLPGTEANPNNDLYVSTSTDQGISWTAPVSLGSVVNSDQNEISPFYDKINQLLYFASDGRDGKGSYDIYFSKRMDNSWTNWSEPKAADVLNSDGFDAYMFVQPDGTAYYSSNKGDSLSSIYVSQFIIEKDTSATDTLSMEEQIANYQEEKMPDPVLIIETKGGKSTSDRQLSSMTREELLDEETNIRFVYFPYDKYNITEKYVEVMDDAAELLDKYPDLKVKIDGHTDAVGSQAYNMVLSVNRAMSTREYLMIHGIEPERIVTEGFGKSKPLSTNLTEEGRGLNRRVEMRFILIEK